MSNEPDTKNTQTNVDRYEAIRHWLFFGLAAIIVILGVIHVFGDAGGWPAKLTIDVNLLYFLGTAGLLLVFERVIKFSVSSTGVSADLADVTKKLENVESKVADVAQSSKENQAALTSGVGGKLPPPPGKQTIIEGKRPRGRGKVPFDDIARGVVYPEDPRKGIFGGKSENNGRKLSASVTPATGLPGNYYVTLTVTSTTPSNPLNGDVTFYLHDTFRTPVRTVAPINGIAELELLAYGAFTVGVETDDKATMLELDLAEDATFPEAFTKE